jgi:hypothetical protein
MENKRNLQRHKTHASILYRSYARVKEDYLLKTVLIHQSLKLKISLSTFLEIDAEYLATTLLTHKISTVKLRAE